MSTSDDKNGIEISGEARKPWVAPQVISSDITDTSSNVLPTFLESTTPTDRPS